MESGPQTYVTCELDDTEDDHYEVDSECLSQLSRQVLSYLGLSDYDLSIKIASPVEMHALNRSFRNKDRSTDVLSFPQVEWAQPVVMGGEAQLVHDVAADATTIDNPPQLLGDIVISLHDAESNAASIGHTLGREVAFLLIHGILHLCGHDHMEEDEERLMLDQQKRILARLDDVSWFECCKRSLH